MSNIDTLIKKLCPDGIPVKKLGEVVKFLNGRAYKKNELLDEGKYPVLRVGNFFTMSTICLPRPIQDRIGVK